MTGSIFFFADRKKWGVRWYWKGNRYTVTRYKGMLMPGIGIKDETKDPGYALAIKLLKQMQGDVENDIFRIEKYLNKGWTDVIPFFEKWLKTKINKKRATYKGYESYFRNWIKPFFHKYPRQLHEIKYDTLTDLLHHILEGLKAKQIQLNPKTELILKLHDEHPEFKSPTLRRIIQKEHGQSISERWIREVIKKSKEPQNITKEDKNHGKTALNIMSCFHNFMDYAWRSERIFEIPPFPKKEAYNIKEPAIRWLPSDRQITIIEAIPEVDQPIFWFLKYHLRRPSEACALHKCDYDILNKVFTIRRSISDRRLETSTKTGKEHIIPCHSNLIPLMDYLSQQEGDFMFQNPRARNQGKRYSDDVLNRIWKAACKKVGEDIDLYSGLKHSSCSQYINETGMALSDLQIITDHARLDSVKKYAKTELARKRALMESGHKDTLKDLLRLINC